MRAGAGRLDAVDGPVGVMMALHAVGQDGEPLQVYVGPWVTDTVRPLLDKQGCCSRSLTPLSV